MKKLTTLLMLALIVFSCNNDDDVLTPVCNTATNVSSNSITNNSATIIWEGTNIFTESYTIEYGVSGFAIGSGTTITETDTNTDLFDLQANTKYDVYIQTVCSANNLSTYTDVYSFTTLEPNVIPEFRPTLSELNIFSGDLDELSISSRAFEYKLNTTLFSDYSHKQRIIALPEGTSMEFDGDGLPIFPNKTVIAKTFFYNIDERDLSLGKTIIETRILIKLNGDWETGDYKWNANQTEAFLDLDGGELPITWIDADGDNNSITYKIPSNTDCFTCHSNSDRTTPIGPKLRSMNFNIDGINQLDQFTNNGQLTGFSDATPVGVLPNWEDTSNSLEARARAYMDMNCAHCHIEGGYCEDESTLDLAFETRLEDSNIVERKFSIEYRISFVSEGLSMPFIGTTILHDEGVDLVQAYLNTL